MTIYVFVYKTTNIINQKYYYGVHKTSNLDDGYLGSGVAIKKAIRKHGKENFNREIIQYFNSIDEAYTHEALLVNRKIVSDQKSYNLCEGGNGAVGALIPTAKTKEKMAKSQRARYKRLGCSPNKGKKLGPRNPEIYIKIAKTRSLRSYIPPMLGKQQSAAAKEKQRIAGLNRVRHACGCGRDFTIQTLGRHQAKCAKVTLNLQDQQLISADLQ